MEDMFVSSDEPEEEFQFNDTVEEEVISCLFWHFLVSVEVS